MNHDRMIRTCSIWRALEVVGDTPSLLILEASWLGIRNFGAFHERTGLLRALLSDRLKHLADTGLLERRQFSEKSQRFEYAMTNKGRDLFPTALMLTRWERLWGRREGKIRVEVTHIGCGRAFQPEVACSHCRENANLSDIDWEAGPGVGLMAPLYSRRRQRREAAGASTSLHEEAAKLMGDRWASLIMRSIFTGIRRFDEIMQDTAIASSILSERLKWLIEFGVIKAEKYEINLHRHEYRLTEKGVDYYYVLLILMKWGDKYYCSPEGPPLFITHRRCSHALDPIVICDQCRQPVRFGTTSLRVMDAESTEQLSFHNHT